jgi:hypothetical protein
MDFECPDGSAYINLRSLNRGFLELLAERHSMPAVPQDIATRIRLMSERQRERLAATPFLLFSLRERDDRYWQSVIATATDRDADLFDPSSATANQRAKLVCATLGYIWQLARNNPYAARLMCGASLHWCETIGEMTLYRLIAAAGTRDDIMVLRHCENSDLWSKLLVSGVRREIMEREAAQVSALQLVLTGGAGGAEAQLAVAACRRRPPRLRVADRTRK